MNSRKKVNWDKILAISTIIIALSAVIVSLWQGFEQRKHNRLSVKPILGLDFIANYAPGLGIGSGHARILVNLKESGRATHESWSI